jgi:hypothetical protein
MISTMRDPIFLDLTTDWRVLGFTSALAILTTLFFGLAPALRAAAADPNSALKATRGMTAGRERFGIRRTLVVTQVALSVVLLVSALLFVRSFQNVMTVDAPFAINGARALAGAADVVELVFADFAAEGVAVNAEELGGSGLVAFGAFEDAADELLFKFRDGFFEADAAVNHGSDERFQLIFHDARSAPEPGTGADDFEINPTSGR